MQLCEQDIFISDERVDKTDALKQVAGKLVQAGNTTRDYLNGMLAREAQISTYLGNGIAIPHGTPETRDAVLNTGVKVIVFRHGVEWGEGNIAHVVMAIAARSNEHLDILRQLTHALSDDSVPAAIEKATTPTDILVILNGQHLAEDKEDATGEGEQATFVVHNPHGLHARPSAVLVKTIKQFECQITVENLDADSRTVDAKNLMRVVSLGVKSGHRLRFKTCGPDAHQALEAIGEAIESGLGEVTTLPATPAPHYVPEVKRSWLARLFN
ncbi:HPr family phosphocarrier protein [Buttiauxella selenatireducens]|uniref:HPr family phosphocarrier protein n=1 Tax=Buttiauxella selenatireducens TaxID=3073902 RepID=A0ABY9S9M5_9ENTR|nr:HPr family phosphocarrier protein [Buttiauxella sp. R73]WMY73871.1 HPr family phosphocarrier protein [Buttiauxella sp. R73]